MKKSAILIFITAAIYLASCTSHPATRDGYISAMQGGGAFIKKFGDIKDVTINLPMDQVFSNIKSQAEKCIVSEYSFDSRISVSFVSTTTVYNYIEAKQTNENRAEFSFEQSTTSGVDKHYELVIDLVKLSADKTQYISYANKRYSDAPLDWANGSENCLGFDGYILDAHKP